MLRMQDKVALVVGSTSGIGKAIAESFAAEGATVIVTGRREEKGQEIVKNIEEKGGVADVCAGIDRSVHLGACHSGKRNSVFADLVPLRSGNVLYEPVQQYLSGDGKMDTGPCAVGDPPGGTSLPAACFPECDGGRDRTGMCAADCGYRGSFRWSHILYRVDGRISGGNRAVKLGRIWGRRRSMCLAKPL